MDGAICVYHSCLPICFEPPGSDEDRKSAFFQASSIFRQSWLRKCGTVPVRWILSAALEQSKNHQPLPFDYVNYYEGVGNRVSGRKVVQPETDQTREVKARPLGRYRI